MTKNTEINIHTPGYDRLAQVLAAAADQASLGKGKERHANDLPFDKQPMQTIAASHGIGFITGQASKKLEEAVGMLERGESEAAIRELLGAIVYAAGAVIFVEDRKAQAGKDLPIIWGDEKGWMLFRGCGSPVSRNALVDVRMRDGLDHLSVPASSVVWSSGDVAAYRLSKGAQ